MSAESENRPPSEEEQPVPAAESQSGEEDAAPLDSAAEAGSDSLSESGVSGEADVEVAATEEDPVAEVEPVEEEPEEPEEPVEPPKKKPIGRSSQLSDADEDVEPLEYFAEEEEDVDAAKDWYILKVAVNRESTVADALARRVKMEGLERYFDEVVVPTEEVTEFTKTGKKRKVKKKLFPGYIVVHMAITDETWFLVRETTGIGDFTGAAGKPTPLLPSEIDRLLARTREPEGEEQKIHNILFKKGDRVRINEGNFQSFEGEVAAIDENNGKVTVEIVIFNRTTPVEFEHWQLEAL
ncbi:transcription termination/antitermination protein NusG [Lignipirellula cremea]|uniref:Transcription termination/antitermination protein NusG n=1 Tax=Lignipirellula cremea TaxID=2528010 RepID=A0A518E2J0_9BACT|nr:transcription termination/antitermination protein NusG [Lignipirellula cremea]QDU98309.1 hypothetical protein Pla8534_61710 [Lignipirellula cremea]